MSTQSSTQKKTFRLTPHEEQLLSKIMKRDGLTTENAAVKECILAYLMHLDLIAEMELRISVLEQHLGLYDSSVSHMLLHSSRLLDLYQERVKERLKESEGKPDGWDSDGMIF